MMGLYVSSVTPVIALHRDLGQHASREKQTRKQSQEHQVFFHGFVSPFAAVEQIFALEGWGFLNSEPPLTPNNSKNSDWYAIRGSNVTSATRAVLR